MHAVPLNIQVKEQNTDLRGGGARLTGAGGAGVGSVHANGELCGVRMKGEDEYQGNFRGEQNHRGIMQSPAHSTAPDTTVSITTGQFQLLFI